MDDREALTHLRSVIARRDHPGLVAALSQPSWPADSLQLIGDGVLGDQELAEVLNGALGAGPTPMLRPLPVDLEELSMILEGDPVHGGGRIDLRTGEVWPQSAIEYAEDVGEIDEEDDDDADRWLWVHCEGSRDGFRDMEWFIENLDDADFADRLARAIAGRGAFRRFKDRLSERADLLTRWHAFSSDRHRGRARSWLAAEGYMAIPQELG